MRVSENVSGFLTLAARRYPVEILSNAAAAPANQPKAAANRAKPPKPAVPKHPANRSGFVAQKVLCKHARLLAQWAWTGQVAAMPLPKHQQAVPKKAAFGVARPKQKAAAPRVARPMSARGDSFHHSLLRALHCYLELNVDGGSTAVAFTSAAACQEGASWQQSTGRTQATAGA